MKKVFLFVLGIVMCVLGIAQPITQRSTSPVTVQDARLFAQFNFRPPVFIDTVDANANIGIDSCGALIFARSINAYYYRACSPKRWISITSQAVNAWLLGGNNAPISTNLGTLDNKEITFITNSLARMRIAGTGINRSSTPRQKYLSIDTSNRYLYYTDGTDTASLSSRINQKIDSLKRNPGTDSVFAQKNGQWVFQYKDSIGGGGGWGLLGNSGTSSSTNFLGTTDNQDLVIKRNNSIVNTFRENGNHSLGSSATVSLITGSNNLAFGSSDMSTITSGSRNVQINNGLTSLTTGNDNIFFGSSSGYPTTSGNYNVYIGRNSGINQFFTGARTGNNNVMIGYSSGKSYLGLTSGAGNTFLGTWAGSNFANTASNNIVIGDSSEIESSISPSSNVSTGNRNIIIGSSVNLTNRLLSNQLNIGNLIFGIDLDGKYKTLSTGKIGIGIVTPTDKLHVNGTAKITDTLKLTSLQTKTDTSANKPLAIDASGNVVKMSNWPTGNSSGLNYVDSLKRNPGTDSVFAQKNGQWVFQYRDSVGVSGGGGGGGKIYYLNGGVNLGTFGGITMYELGDTAVTGTAADFTRATTGNIANFITDVNKPGLLQIPAGVWTIDAYFSETGGGSNNAEIYAILEKWDGSTLTVIATSPIEQLTNGSVKDLYTFAISVPTTTLSITDRIVIQFYIQNTNGKTVTLYTQNGNVGEVHTTFTTGIGALNGLTAPSQTFVVGTSGTDFNISSATSTHTFNLPTASATNRGALSTTDWSTFNGKIGASDTSVFQRKSVAAFTFKANNTSSTANATDQVFRDSGTLTYSGTINWTGTTPPSGTPSHRYRWCQIGKQVTITISLNYSSAGTALTAVKLTLPAGCPNPTNFGTLTAANDILGSAWAFLGTSTASATTGRVLLQNNAGNNGYEFNISSSSGSYRTAGFTLTYFTD